MGKPKGRTAKKGRTLSREDREWLRLQTDLVGQEKSHLQNIGMDQGRVLRSRSIPPFQPQPPQSILDKNGPQIPEPPPPPLVGVLSSSNPTKNINSRGTDVQFDPGIHDKTHPPAATKVKSPVPPRKSSLTPPSGQAVSQGIPQWPKPETEIIDKETVMTPKFTSPDPITTPKINHRDHPHSSGMESDDYHQISTQLKHTAAKINEQLLSLQLQDKTITPSEKASKDIRNDKYEYDDGEVQLKVVMPLDEGNDFNELVSLSVEDPPMRFPPGSIPREKIGMSGIF